MSIGETLARARRDAGLSIAEISFRTRIRQSVIEGIESDDFSACGGDSGARGDIAALARALRADSATLLQAYDAARQPGEWIAAAAPPQPVNPVQAPEAVTPAHAFPLPQEPRPVTAGPDTDTLPILMGQPPEPVTGDVPPSPFTTGEPPPIAAGGPPWPVTPSGTSRPALTGRRQVIWTALAALLAFAGLGGVLLLLGASGQAAPHGAGTGPNRGGSSGATRAARPQHPSPGHYARSPRPTRVASPASRRPVRALAAASIAAFGPGGTRHGDNPRLHPGTAPGTPQRISGTCRTAPGCSWTWDGQ